MLRALALLLALGVALPALAQDAATAADATPADWHDRLEVERAAIEAARNEVQNAQIALGDARQRRRPRGRELAKLRARLEAARTDLASREAAWPALLEEARRAGVPPSVLSEFEEAFPTPE